MNTKIMKIFNCFWIILAVALSLSGSAVAQDLVETWKKEWPVTNFSKHSVVLSEIDSTVIPKNGIPSITRPRFVSIKRARKWVGDEEPVMSVVVEGAARAYPLQIMIYHQIVNDTIKGKPVLITFCPLCNNGLVLSRVVDSKVLTFGTTGKLRNSGLIMYDRESESWWQQFTGTAIVGKYAGTALEQDNSAQIISLAQFSELYPKGKVLSRDTSYRRDYGSNPFQGYDSIDSSPYLFPDETDPRLPPMERVLNIRLGDTHILYPYRSIKERRIINDIVNTTPVVVLSGAGYLSTQDETDILSSATVPLAIGYERTVDGTVLSFSLNGDVIVDDQTGSQWTIFGEAVSGSLTGTQLKRVDTGTHFAFAALAFSPKAEVYSAP